MNILSDVYQSILNAMPQKPPEIGGILGGTDDIVNEYRIDEGRFCGCGCFYTPDVELLNSTIKKWQSENIKFMGIFHSHFFSVRTLSEGDIHYIKKIVQAMPEGINQLYFPVVVIPDKEIVSYFAVRNGKSIEIKFDETFVIRKE